MKLTIFVQVGIFLIPVLMLLLTSVDARCCCCCRDEVAKKFHSIWKKQEKQRL